VLEAPHLLATRCKLFLHSPHPPSSCALQRVLPSLRQLRNGDAAQGAGCSPSQATRLREALPRTSEPRPAAPLFADLPLRRGCRCWPLQLTNYGPPTARSRCVSTALQDWNPHARRWADLEAASQLLPASFMAGVRRSAQTVCRTDPSGIPLRQRQRTWAHNPTCPTSSSFTRYHPRAEQLLRAGHKQKLV